MPWAGAAEHIEWISGSPLPHGPPRTAAPARSPGARETAARETGAGAGRTAARPTARVGRAGGRRAVAGPRRGHRRVPPPAPLGGTGRDQQPLIIFWMEPDSPWLNSLLLFFPAGIDRHSSQVFSASASCTLTLAVVEQWLL